MEGLFEPGLRVALRRALTEPRATWTSEGVAVRLHPSRAALGCATAGAVAMLAALGVALGGEASPLTVFPFAAALIALGIWGPARGEALVLSAEVRQGGAVRPLPGFAGLRPVREWGWLAGLNRPPFEQGPARPADDSPARGWLLLEARDGGPTVPLLAAAGRPVTQGELAAFARRLDVAVPPELRVR